MTVETLGKKADRNKPIAAERYYAVVYQFGKVASTSIVATLNELPGVTAVQSHFLGEAALSSIIPTITGAGVSQYFFQHQLGQFVHNTKITRHINCVRAGQTKERLVVISLSRDPVAWIRSSIVQDMVGYIDPLRAYAARQGLHGSDDSALITGALSHLLGSAADLIAAQGGVDPLIDALQKRGAAVWTDTPFAGDDGAQRLIRMMLRPFDWFEKHYKVALGIGLEQMARTDLGLEYRDDTGRFLIMRYEDIAATIPAYIRNLGLAENVELKRENASDEKLMASEVADAFGSEGARRLAELSGHSKYSAAFGY